MHEYYIGLMSGTSMDAIDGVLVDFSKKKPQVLAHHNQVLPDYIRTALTSLIYQGDNEILSMMQLDIKMGQQFAAAVISLLDKTGLQAEHIKAVGSHGQTLRHYPDGEFPNSLQIGDANTIAQLTGITTVADFRRRDMAAGGQGAPLVPAFHAAVFANNEMDQVVLNIGGIANITLLKKSGEISGFDTGPGNCLMDSWVHQQLGVRYDRDGEWAASGYIHPGLLERMSNDAYFSRSWPKSTGREYFNLDWLNTALASFPGLAAPDIQATLLELTARSVCEAIETAMPSVERVLVCGGGVFNNKLMQRLSELLPAQQIMSTENFHLLPDQVEAAAFAWLAKQTLEKKPGNIPGVTGARQPVILGAVYQA